MRVPLTKILTYEEYLATPCTRRRFEIINGVLFFMEPPPGKAHQWALGKLACAMSDVAGDRGNVWIAPFDVIISRKPLRTRQPDIFFVRSDRRHIVGDQVEGGPDVMVEILSRSQPRKLALEKLRDYASIGVRECWMVDLGTQSLLTWVNDAGTFRPAAAFGAGQEVHSKVFPAFELPAVVFGSK